MRIPILRFFQNSTASVREIAACHTPSSASGKRRAKEITAYLEKKFKEVADDAEFQKIMKDIGQPVMYQNAEEYKTWFKQAYDQFGTQYKSLGIDTK